MQMERDAVELLHPVERELKEKGVGEDLRLNQLGCRGAHAWTDTLPEILQLRRRDERVHARAREFNL